MESNTPKSRKFQFKPPFFESVGAGFSIGIGAGSTLPFIHSAINNSKGQRLSGGIQEVAKHAPRLGCLCAAFFAIYSVSHSTIVYIRQKEDEWNPLIACAVACGLPAVRQGLSGATRMAMIGGVAYALVSKGEKHMSTKENNNQETTEKLGSSDALVE